MRRKAFTLIELMIVLAFIALIAAIILFRHRENIERLRAGVERRIGERVQAAA